jgi:hypothetical protein
MRFVGSVSRITKGRYFRHLNSITIKEISVSYNVIKKIKYKLYSNVNYCSLYSSLSLNR